MWCNMDLLQMSHNRITGVFFCDCGKKPSDFIKSANSTWAVVGFWWMSVLLWIGLSVSYNKPPYEFHIKIPNPLQEVLSTFISTPRMISQHSFDPEQNKRKGIATWILHLLNCALFFFRLVFYFICDQFNLACFRLCNKGLVEATRSMLFASSAITRPCCWCECTVQQNDTHTTIWGKVWTRAGETSSVLYHMRARCTLTTGLVVRRSGPKLL